MERNTQTDTHSHKPTETYRPTHTQTQTDRDIQTSTYRHNKHTQIYIPAYNHTHANTQIYTQ